MDSRFFKRERDIDGGGLQVGLSAREREEEGHVAPFIGSGVLAERHTAILKMGGRGSRNVGDASYIFREFCVNSNGAIGAGVIG